MTLARIVFMGTSAFAVPVLEALSREHEVLAVYTQPDRPAGRGRREEMSAVKRKALSLGLPVLQPGRLREPGVVETLTAFKADAVALAAYGQLLPKAVLEAPAKGCLNVHPSLLPRHRGPSPIQGAMLAGDWETGVTVMLMNEAMDAGRLLAQRRVNVATEDTSETLTATLSGQGAELLLEVLPQWLEGKIAAQPQDESQITFTHILTKADGAMNWNLPALELARRVRALTPWPGCYTFWQGRRLIIHETLPLLDAAGGIPGRVTALKGRSGLEVGVETAHGVLGLARVQLEGKRPLSGGDFLRGQPGFLGTVLPALELPRLQPVQKV